MTGRRFAARGAFVLAAVACGGERPAADAADPDALLASLQLTLDTVENLEVRQYEVPPNVRREIANDSTATTVALITLPAKREALASFAVRYRGPAPLQLAAIELEVGGERARLRVDSARLQAFESLGAHYETTYFSMEDGELSRVLAQLETDTVGVVRFLGREGRVEHRLTSWERMGIRDVHRAYQALRVNGYRVER